MINKLIPLVLVVGVLSGCDGGAPPKAASVISNATNISATFPAAYASLPKKARGGGVDGVNFLREFNSYFDRIL